MVEKYEPAKCSSFELLAAVQAVAELEETAVVFRDLVDQMSAGVDLTQGEFVMILVVQDIQEGGHERVQVL